MIFFTHFHLLFIWLCLLVQWCFRDCSMHPPSAALRKSYAKTIKCTNRKRIIASRWRHTTLPTKNFISIHVNWQTLWSGFSIRCFSSFAVSLLLFVCISHDFACRDTFALFVYLINFTSLFHAHPFSWLRTNNLFIFPAGYQTKQEQKRKTTRQK